MAVVCPFFSVRCLTLTRDWKSIASCKGRKEARDRRDLWPHYEVEMSEVKVSRPINVVTEYQPYLRNGKTTFHSALHHSQNFVTRRHFNQNRNRAIDTVQCVSSREWGGRNITFLALFHTHKFSWVPFLAQMSGRSIILYICTYVHFKTLFYYQQGGKITILNKNRIVFVLH